MEYNEEDFLMLSGIQHFSFCRRQWALIHIEQVWEDNVHTVAGNLMHKKAHDGFSSEKRKDVLISRGMPILSRELGITGVCDIVEFHRLSENESGEGIFLKKHKGTFKVYPVEYKKGKPKKTEEDILQLVAQMMCLEEMFCTTIERGALFYGGTRHREEIAGTGEMKNKVKNMCKEMHQLFDRKHTPVVKQSAKCRGCSLKELCLPGLTKSPPASEYVNQIISEME